MIIGSYPFNIQSGQLVSAAPVMGDFNFIQAQVNANAVSLTQLAQTIFPQGSSIVGYIPPGTGAIGITVSSRLNQTIVLDAGYGADPTGVNDSTPAMTAAIAALPNAVGMIIVPPGLYKLSTFTVTEGQHIVGFGENATFFVGSGTTNNLVSITGSGAFNEVEIAHLGIKYSATQTAGAAIYVKNGHRIHLHDLRIDSPFIGIDWNGGATQDEYFGKDIEINQPTIGIRAGFDGTQVADLFLSKIVIGTASQYGIQLLNNSGYYFTNCLMLSCATGMRIAPASGKSVTAGLLHAVMCDGSTGNGWELVNTAGSDLSDLTATNCWACSSGSGLGGAGVENGVWISATSPIDAVTFNGWLINNNKGAGIQYDSGQRIQIKNCQINCNSQASSGTRSGVECGAATANFQIDQNFIGVGGRIGVVTGFVATQKYGISVALGATNFDLIGNDVDNNVTAGINDLSAGVRKAVSKNKGYNPLPATNISLGASPATWTNTTGDTATFICNGGVVSVITLAGIQVASGTGVSISVPNLQSVVVTYSSLPGQVQYVGT